MSPALHLLRHCRTEDARPGAGDAERRLTAEGERAADDLGRWLRTTGPAVEQVWCSPAVRTRQTLAGLALAVEPSVEEWLYHADVTELLERVSACPAEVGSLLVVGHNPTMAQAAGRLGQGHPEAEQAARGFPPGSWLTVDVPAWDRLAEAVPRVLRLG